MGFLVLVGLFVLLPAFWLHSSSLSFGELLVDAKAARPWA